jgi:hypothetical protein
MWLEGVPGERGFDSVEDVSPLSPKKRPRPFLAINFSLEVLSWFIDDSSEETSSSIASTSVVTGGVVAVVIVKKLQPLPHGRRGLDLILHLAIVG